MLIAKFLEETNAVIEAEKRVLTFRIKHRTGSYCCPMHHTASFFSHREGDTNDAEVMHRLAVWCNTHRLIGDPILSALAEFADVETEYERHHSRGWYERAIRAERGM